MHPVSGAQLNHILSFLDSGHSAHDISPLTGLHHTTISRMQRNITLIFRRPLVGTLPSFLRQILTMPNTSSPPGRLRMPPRSLKFSRKSPTSPSPLRQP